MHRLSLKSRDILRKKNTWCHVTNSSIDVVALHRLSQIMLVKHNPPKLFLDSKDAKAT